MILHSLNCLFWGVVCGAVCPAALLDLIPYIAFYL